MLVLSRRLNETIRRPGETPLRQSARRSREGLKTASMGLGLARLQLRAGQTQEAQATLDQIHGDIQRLRQCLEAESKKPTRRRSVRARALPPTEEGIDACELAALGSTN